MSTYYTSCPTPKPAKREKLRKRMPKVSAKQARINREWSKVTREVITLHNGWCAVLSLRSLCTELATEGHHIVPRSLGGKHEAKNCLPVCRNCHAWIEANPKAAVRLGYLVLRKEVA